MVPLFSINSQLLRVHHFVVIFLHFYIQKETSIEKANAYFVNFNHLKCLAVGNEILVYFCVNFFKIEKGWILYPG